MTEDVEVKDYDLKKMILGIFSKMYLVITILIIVLNIMICFVLVYYGNILAFLFIVNIFYIVSYYRMVKREKIKNAIG